MKLNKIMLLSLIMSSLALAGYDDPFYDYRGQNSFRESEPYQPEERFDPFTGNITLVYTDVYLPGDGGLDLSINRVYNSDIRRYNYGIWQLVPDSWVGVGWSLHMGKLFYPPDPEPKYLEMPDGSKHTFYSDLNTPGQRISKEYWVLRQISGGYEILFTNGIKWTFYESLYGSIPEQGGPLIYYPTKTIRDPCGNQIAISYQMLNNQTLISHITDACGRTINFNYATTGNMNLNSITNVYGQYYAQYSYDSIGEGYSLLRKVQLPCDPSGYYSYKYDYTTIFPEHELKKAYNPWGGNVNYTFTTRTILARYYRILSQRQETPGGIWAVTYGTTTNNCDSTVVNDPYTTKTSFIFYGYNYAPTSGNNWKIGLMIRKRIIGTGVNLLINCTYDKSPAISEDDYSGPTSYDNYIYVPRLTKKEFTIDGKTYTTDYSNFDNYNQPKLIAESGDTVRTITKTYWYNANLNIVDRVASEIVNYNSTSYSKNFSYNNSNGLTTSKNIAGVATAYTYHANGNLKRVTDASGRLIQYTEYQYGVPKIIHIGYAPHEPETVDVKSGYAITRVINWPGTIASETNGRGYTTNFRYDGRNRLICIIPPIGDSTITEYHNQGDYKKISQGSSWTKYVYDDWGRVDYTENSVGVKVDYTYDNIGRKTYESYPYTSTNIGRSFTYDGLDRIKKITNPDNSYAEYTYYQSKVTYRNERAKNTEFQYHAFGNCFGDKLLISVKDALNQTTTYAYNAASYLTSISAAGSYTRTYHYNTKYFLDYEISPERGQTNYIYDNAGNLTQRTDANVNTTAYTYDNVTRLTNSNYPGTSYDVTYTYDNADNLTQMTTPSNTINQTYDAVNRITKKVLNIDGYAYADSFVYDGRSNITKIKYPDNQYVEFTYDSENRVLTIPGYINSNITYHPSGMEASYTTANGRTTTVQFSNRYRISNITVSGNIMNEGYIYDAIGNLTSLTDYINSSNSQTLSYDDIDRLKTFYGPWGSGTYNYTSSYAIGRRYQEIIGSNTTTYNYHSTTHRLTSTTGATPYQFNYDNNGNLKYIVNQESLTYDYENRPVIIDNFNSRRTDLAYDGKGVRVKLVLGPLYQKQLVDESEPEFDDRGDNTYYATGPHSEVLYEDKALETKYVYLNGKKLCEVSGSSELFYHDDYLGSAKAMTNNAGTKIYSWLGYPFGKEYSIVGGGYNNYRFTGKEYDQSTGFYYFGARYYMPEIGRFITADPIKGLRSLNLKDPLSLNLYAYAKENPLKFIDPQGKQVFENENKLLEGGNDVLDDPNLQSASTQPSCNVAVDRIAEMGGNLDYHNLTANQIIVKLENKEYATEITDVNAAEYANKGAVVIAGAKEAVGSGHVAVVAPTPLGQLGTSGAWKITKTGTIPKVFNVGTSVGLKYANYGFRGNNPPKYYIRNVDKMKVDEMNKELRNE